MLKKFSLIAVLVFFAAVSLPAAPWMSRNHRVPQSLIVVSNYKVPRLLAATIKGLTSQPYVIITADQRYFVALRKATVEIKGSDFGARINKLAPKRIIIIGDERYVSREQENFMRKQLNLKRIPIVRIYGGDWGRVAEELDDMLNIGNLAREFRRNYFTVAMSDNRWAGEVPGEQKQETAPAAEKVPAVPGEDDLPAAEPESLTENK